MFSSAPTPTPSISSRRNPRRRQRGSSDENGVSLPRAKRQRSALKADTFVKPGGGEHSAEDGPVSNGAGSQGRSASRGVSVDMPVRAAKKSGERGSKDDGSIVLTKNNQYAVTKLPALPDRVRKSSKERAQGEIFSDAAYALALTATHALVWPYTTTVSSPETFVFTLPYPCKNLADPLPLGCLVAASASLAEPGLVVVMPLTGKITYWESITSAAALDLIRQQRLGVEGTVGSLFSGETIVQIENAEPAGFILSFSSGRIALLSVRDGQGRPSISVQFIKSTGTGTTGGFFGGLKNVFGTGAWRRDVAAVRSGPSKRGSRTVGMATAAGILQVWDVQRGGHHSLQCEADVKQDMMAAIKRVEPELQSKASEDFELIDFNFVPESSRGDELSLQNETSKAKMMVLAAFRGTNSSYTLVEVSIARNTATFGLIQPIRCYTSPTPSNSLRRPRLYLPQPRHTAFIVFERAVVVASLVRIAESPDQQLLSDSHELLEPFEDVVDFREGLDSSIVGSNAEEGREPEAPAAEDGKPARRRTRDPACVLLVRGGGVVRVTAYAPPKDPREAEAATVQSKIEQAIHYGGEAQNPLNFAGRHETQFPLEEVEAAALQVSHDIVDSQSKAVTLVAPSMDYQLKQRAAALRQLAVYLRDTFPPLSRLTKWQLLWDAEKLAAARGVWKLYDTRLREKVSSKQYALLAQLVDMMNEELNEQAREDIGELDRVRHWFVRNVSRIQYMVVWAYNSVSEIQQAGRKDMATLTGLVSEANDISLGALETAFRFRRENLSLYGLENEVHQDGVLLKGYEALPEFWTSIHLIVTSTKALVDLSRELAINYWKKDKEVGAPDPKVIQKIGEENVRQVEVCCQVYQERFRWCLVQDDDRLRSEGRALKQLHLGVRKGQIGRLSFLDQTDAAIVLAEKYHVMQTLVQLLADEIGSLGARSEQHGLSEEDAAMLEDRMASLEGRLAANFRTFGDDWARALFTEHIKKGQLSTLMNDNDEWSQYLTRFLRGNPAYAKLSWMNDVIVEKDFDLASQALLEFARNKENDLWAKRVELSIGKLAKLSAHENQEQSETEVDEFDWVDDELDIVTIQQRLYEHISPVLHAALDGKAELDLAMTELGKRTKGNKPALNKVLQQGLADLLAHNSLGVAQLIDVLTLLDPYFDAEAPDAIAGQEFHLALRALRLGGEDDKTDADLNEKIIWRRCMIRDDWAAINDTQLKDDKALERATSGTALFRTSKAGYIADSSNGGPRFRPLRPSEVLGAGCSASDLTSRFKEDLRETVAADMRKEDAQLRKYIDRGRLEDWFQGIGEAAKKSIVDDRIAEETAAKRLRDMENSMRDARAEGKVGKARDDDGDVFMG